MKIIKTTLVLIYLIFSIGCGKEVTPQRPISQADMWNCYNSTEWTNLKIRDALIGNWKWIYSESPWAPEKGTNTSDENIFVEFLKDSTFNLTVNGKVQGSTKWHITSKDGELYGIELDTFITSLIHGRILICDKTLESNNSYVDGEDNYFSKID